MFSRTIFFVFSLMLSLGLAPLNASAAYPDQPLKFVVPWPPGGAADIMARLIGDGLKEELGQPVIVENKPGAGGLMGTEQVTRMAPDGYTLLLGSTGPNSIAVSLYDNMHYDPVDDLTPVSQITELPLLLVVNDDFPAKTAEELIAYAKANPGKINFGSVGIGTAQHLASEIFKMGADIDIVHVPYKGSAPAFADLASGQIQMLFDNIPASRSMLESGKVRAIAISTLNRSSEMPDIPTVAESGVPGYHVSAWQNILMPPKSPRESVDRVNAAIAKVMNKPEVRDRITGMGANIVVNSPDEELQRIKDEVAKWHKAIEAGGIKIEQ